MDIIHIMGASTIQDQLFHEAVQAIDAGELVKLQSLLDDHPNLVHERLLQPGTWLSEKVGDALQDFFKEPYLLWFVADNPIRHERLPANIVEVTHLLIDAVRQHASESEFDSKRKRLLDVLEQWRREHGDAWMPFWRINRKLPWSPRDHEEIRHTLLLQRLIEAKVITTRGRSGQVYRLPAMAQEEEAA